MSLNNWLQPEKLYRVVCRPALPKDTEDVMELTSKIWEGDDYVPHVWAEWMVDYQGLLAVAEYGGRVVGLSKLTRLDPDSWWLEGLRVHPQYEGLRIASRLHDYLLDHWQQAGNGVIRLATGSFREPVKHLSKRTGFRKVLEVTSWIAAPISEEDTRYEKTGESELSAALDFAMKSQTLDLSAGFVELGWRWASPTHQHLREVIERDGAWWWVLDGRRYGLLLARMDEHEGKSMLMIQLVACDAERFTACLHDVRTLAVGQGAELVAWFAPLHPQVEESLREAGFERDWDDSLYIYEKWHT